MDVAIDVTAINRSIEIPFEKKCICASMARLKNSMRRYIFEKITNLHKTKAQCTW